MTLYDRGIRTPLVVRWPSRIPAGVRSDALVSLIDLADDPQFADVRADMHRRLVEFAGRVGDDAYDLGT